MPVSYTMTSIIKKHADKVPKSSMISLPLQEYVAKINVHVPSISFKVTPGNDAREHRWATLKQKAIMAICFTSDFNFSIDSLEKKSIRASIIKQSQEEESPYVPKHLSITCCTQPESKF